MTRASLLKNRHRVPTPSASSETKPITGQTPAEIPQDHPMVLQYQLAYVKHMLEGATQRKARLEEVMQRRGAKKWPAAKKAQMVRRLVTANQTVEQCTAATDELAKKMEEVMAKLLPPSTATTGFVPPTPTTNTEPVPEAAMPEFAGSGIENPFGG
jgi:hypothetical protein